MLRAQTSSMAGSFPRSLFTKNPSAGIQQISQIITNSAASSTLTLSGFTLLLKSREADKFCLFCLAQFNVSPQLFLCVCVSVCVCSIQLTSNYSGSKSDHFFQVLGYSPATMARHQKSQAAIYSPKYYSRSCELHHICSLCLRARKNFGLPFFLQSSFRKRILRECVME